MLVGLQELQVSRTVLLAYSLVVRLVKGLDDVWHGGSLRPLQQG